MPAVKDDYPHSIRCLKALEAYHGGRKFLALKLGITEQTISQWIVRDIITPKYVLALLDISDGRFSAEEFLGKFDGGLHEDA